MASVGAAEQRIHELTGMRAGKFQLGASFIIGLYVLPRVLAAYRHAVAERYRFFSYGDCMFIA